MEKASTARDVCLGMEIDLKYLKCIFNGSVSLSDFTGFNIHKVLNIIYYV